MPEKKEIWLIFWGLMFLFLEGVVIQCIGDSEGGWGPSNHKGVKSPHPVVGRTMDDGHYK